MDDRHEFVNGWLLWTVLHTLGSMFGVLFGELLGQHTAQLWTPTAGHLVAFLVFEAFIWLPRLFCFNASGPTRQQRAQSKLTG